MTLQEINKAYNRIVGSLDSKELKNAFDSLQALIAGSREYSFQDKLNELQDTYKYMLRYRIEGAKDPMQEQIYNNLQASTYELADSVKQKAVAVESPLSYYSRRRSLNIQPSLTYKQLHDQLLLEHEAGKHKESDAFNILIFNKIWVSSFLKREEAEDIRGMLHDNALPFTTGSQIVSALMLGLQEAFDREKILLLFDAASHPNEEVKVRALISILITLYTYRKRTQLYPQIADRLAALAETPGFIKTIRTIILRFILARETEKITRKLQDEIIPEMLKLSPKLSKKINLNELTPEDLTGNEMNPEWESFFSDSTLGKKMVEFGELQQEGADVMHSTFVHLKNFPFFHELSNWLLPFTIEHSYFDDQFTPDNEAEKQMLDSMTFAAFMCNSDKYSLYFSMMQLPKEARKMMMNQFDSQATEMIQQNKEELISKRGKQDTIIGQYIQDLYRFFKLYPGHLDFTDIFTMPLDFHNLAIHTEVGNHGDTEHFDATMIGNNHFRHCRHTYCICTENMEQFIFGRCLKRRALRTDIYAVLHLNSFFCCNSIRLTDQLFVIRLTHIRETRAIRNVLATQRMFREVIDMIRNNHQVADFKIRIRTTAGI